MEVRSSQRGISGNYLGFLLGILEVCSLGMRANLLKDKPSQRLKISFKLSQCLTGSRWSPPNPCILNKEWRLVFGWYEKNRVSSLPSKTQPCLLNKMLSLNTDFLSLGFLGYHIEFTEDILNESGSVLRNNGE